MSLFKLHLPPVGLNELVLRESESTGAATSEWPPGLLCVCIIAPVGCVFRVKSYNWTSSQLVLLGQRWSWGMPLMSSTRRRGSQRGEKSECSVQSPGDHSSFRRKTQWSFISGFRSQAWKVAVWIIQSFPADMWKHIFLCLINIL